MPMHVSSGLFIDEAEWLPRLWVTVSCFHSCSITSPLTPTCGSPALWQEGISCGGGKLKHSWLVGRAELCLGLKKDAKLWHLLRCFKFPFTAVHYTSPRSLPTTGQIKMHHQFITQPHCLAHPAPHKNTPVIIAFRANIDISSCKW